MMSNYCIWFSGYFVSGNIRRKSCHQRNSAGDDCRAADNVPKCAAGRHQPTNGLRQVMPFSTPRNPVACDPFGKALNRARALASAVLLDARANGAVIRRVERDADCFYLFGGNPGITVRVVNRQPSKHRHGWRADQSLLRLGTSFENRRTGRYPHHRSAGKSRTGLKQTNGVDHGWLVAAGPEEGGGS